MNLNSQISLPFQTLHRGAFAFPEVEVIWNPTRRQLAPELAKQIDTHWQHEIARNPARSHLFNGDLCRLAGSWTNSERLTLDLEMTDYKRLLFSNYLRENGSAADVEFNARALGISAVLVSGDAQIVLIRRSESVGEDPGRLDVFGGHLDPVEHLVDGAPNPFAGIAAELREEAGVDLPAERFTCIGLIETCVTRKPELIFYLPVGSSAREIIRGAVNTGCDEIDGLLAIPNEKSAVVTLLEREGHELSASAFGSLWLYQESVL